MVPPKHNHRRNHNEPGHAHVLTFSCYRGYKFLVAERTCEWLAEAINDARREFDFALWAYVFMPEHVHLIVWPRRKVYDIADIRHAIKSPVATRAIRYLKEESPEWLQRVTRTRSGKTERTFWQSGGGYDRNIDQPATLLKEVDYIHMNPVRKGLVKCADEWKWSSAAWFFGSGTPVLIPDSIPADWIA
jgi:putative transposase